LYFGEPDQTTLRILENDATGPDPSVISFSWITDAIIEETDAVNLAVNIDVANDCSIDVQVNTALSTADNGVDFTFDDPQTLLSPVVDQLQQSLRCYLMKTLPLKEMK
jgi:hypothetical protein